MTDIGIGSGEGRGAGEDDKIRGIVEQVKGDLALGSSKDARAILTQRLSDVGIEVPDDRIAGLVRDIEG